MSLCTGGPRILISRVAALSFVICIAIVSSTALYSGAQQTARAVTSSAVTPSPSPTVTPSPSPTVTPLPSITVSPTASANQTGGGGADPTLIGAAIIGIIAVGLMVGIYYTTRRL